MLLFALGLDGSLHWKLGYGKPAYLGSLRPSLVRARFLTGRYGVRVGQAADPADLAREYAESGCGWAGVREAVAALCAGSGCVADAKFLVGKRDTSSAPPSSPWRQVVAAGVKAVHPA